MTATAVKDEQALGLFVKSDFDDYGLNPYEFRIYARIVRRAGRSDAWESIPNMAKACMMSESRARRALQVLEAARLIESIERSGYSALRRPTPKSVWANPDQLSTIRAMFTRTKSVTPIKSDTGKKTHTPSKSDTGVVAELTPLPLAKVTDEGIPIKGNPIKVLPLTSEPEMGGQKENLNLTDELVFAVTSSQEQNQPLNDEQADDFKNAKQAPQVASYLNYLSQQVADVVQNTLSQLISSFALNPIPGALIASEISDFQLPTELATSTGKAKIAAIRRSAASTTKLQSKANSTKPKKAKSTAQTTLAPTLPVLQSPERTQLLQELSKYTCELPDSLQLNPNLASALDRYPERVTDALEYFKQANATWKNKPGIGLFISAVNKGMKPSLTKPGSGWKEWADEALRRRLMSYSQSCNGDILIHLANGVQRLWSEIRSLSWSEIENLACSDCFDQNAA
ncbi:MAG: helix-turn-helix domain-containing protein [Gloeocapsa sp. UFS-A4-WI-NPMV-4B04]|jgi:DNA-binding transcriptional ArsR family regulator|nr:helix-turn-helix domain-containing protein [Gloeocapsa sp. UFS-A4-WI-NPMV-4B04]